MSDVQLLLATMEDGKTSVSKEELEKVHSQVRNALIRRGSSSGKHGQRLPPIGRWRYGPGSHKAVGSEGQDVLPSVGWSQL